MGTPPTPRPCSQVGAAQAWSASPQAQACSGTGSAGALAKAGRRRAQAASRSAGRIASSLLGLRQQEGRAHGTLASRLVRLAEHRGGATALHLAFALPGAASHAAAVPDERPSCAARAVRAALLHCEAELRQAGEAGSGSMRGEGEGGSLLHFGASRVADREGNLPLHVAMHHATHRG